jgi:hypothetical protein
VASNYRGRRAAQIQNDVLRVSVLEEGGHVAEILDRGTNVNPLWAPAWPSIEPFTYDRAKHPEYGDTAEASLLSGIMGWNLCLDIFGGPSAEEAAAGMPVHGETSLARFEFDVRGAEMSMETVLSAAQLRVQRHLALDGRVLRVRETVENLTAADRPVGWTEHVTLGAPFLERGVTQFRASATRSKAYDAQVGDDDYMVRGAEFEWPNAPLTAGGTRDLRLYNASSKSSGYTAHLMDRSREDAFFVASSPTLRLAFGCRWRRSDFPWLGIWEENHSRKHAPWNGRQLTCGMEFGVSPMPETRRAMIERGRLFDTPTFRWIPAKSRVSVDYVAALGGIGEFVNW